MAGQSQEIIQRIELTRDDIGRTAELLTRRLHLRSPVRAVDGQPGGGATVAALPGRVLASATARLALAVAAGWMLGYLTRRRRRRFG